MNIQSVKPNSGNQEGVWIGGIIAAILLVATVAIPYHQQITSTSKLKAHQVSIQDLQQDDLAMITELRLAFEEIQDLRLEGTVIPSTQHQQAQVTQLEDIDAQKDSHKGAQIEPIWPSVQSLENSWVAPFVQDQSWKRKGQHQWTLLGDGFYLGRRTSANGSSSVVLNSQAATPDIWLASSETSLDLNDDISLPILLNKHWTQVSFHTPTESPSH